MREREPDLMLIAGTNLIEHIRRHSGTYTVLCMLAVLFIVRCTS